MHEFVTAIHKKIHNLLRKDWCSSQTWITNGNFALLLLLHRRMTRIKQIETRNELEWDEDEKKKREGKEVTPFYGKMYCLLSCRIRLGSVYTSYPWISNNYSSSSSIRERRGGCSCIIIIRMVPIGRYITQEHTKKEKTEMYCLFCIVVPYPIRYCTYAVPMDRQQLQ